MAEDAVWEKLLGVVGCASTSLRVGLVRHSSVQGTLQKDIPASCAFIAEGVVLRSPSSTLLNRTMCIHTDLKPRCATRHIAKTTLMYNVTVECSVQLYKCLNTILLTMS
eukprot:m.1507027 g.1507027  ORF g.1507027 m.1507027 type:complete len:109 (-) comp25209_c0_seq104:894-1220(-)